MAYTGFQRFKVPDYDRNALKGLDWSAPSPVDDGAATDVGAHHVSGGEALLDHFKIVGDNAGVIKVVLPDGGGRLVGRSWTWPIQRAVVATSLDPGAMQVVADWRTPRPMNTRLGPEDGIDVPGGALYVASGAGNADHFIANRTLIRADDASARILAAWETQPDAFHAVDLTFTWDA